MQCEHCDTKCDAKDDEVFVQGVALLEDCEVQKHDGEEFAGFGEDEGYVVDVF